MSNPLEAAVECPFYINNHLKCLYCECAIPGASAQFTFKSVKAKTEYIKNICSANKGKKCLHYRSMMILYERGMLK